MLNAAVPGALPDPLPDVVARLWDRHVGRAGALTLTPCATGGNNRVFIVRAGDGTAAGTRAVVGKWYAPDAAGTRDRLDAEWRFLTYAATAGIPGPPQPLARDDDARLALHEFCPGTRPTAAAIGDAAVAAAAALFRALNDPRHRPAAAGLPDAAEACFSPAAHIALLDRRMARLSGVPADGDAPLDAAPLDAEARDLVTAMATAWAGMRQRLPAQLAALGSDPDAGLAPAERCVSPSDFGFHNALLGPDGALRFVDFEYAGWDDPAKTLCDFFLQPAVPVDRRHEARFVADAFGAGPAVERLVARANLLRPLFALKWCCIMLNPFVPELAGRARFADPTRSDDDRKRQRLAAATAAFHSLRGA